MTVKYNCDCVCFNVKFIRRNRGGDADGISRHRLLRHRVCLKTDGTTGHLWDRTEHSFHSWRPYRRPDDNGTAIIAN